MLLQRLVERIASEDLGPRGYAKLPVRYEVMLDRDGDPLGIATLTGADDRRKDRGLVMYAPSVVRAAGIKPKLLTDTAEYALGWGRPEKAERYHQAFIDLVIACIDATQEPAVRAVGDYLSRPAEDRLPMPDDFDTSATVTFTVDGARPVDLPSVQAFWAHHSDRSVTSDGDGEAATQCIVCGERKPVLPRLPQMIKGVPGGQPSGTALISANNNAFASYGLTENFIAPTCSSCAELFCKSLNELLANEASRLFLRPLVYVFWTREPVDLLFGSFMTRPDEGQVKALLQAVRSGKRGATDLDGNAFYCAGLTGNGGRVVVRDWIDTTVTQAQAHLARYFLLQRIVDRTGQPDRYYGVRALAGATTRTGGKDDPAPPVQQALLRVALRGGPLPDALLAQTVRRVKVEQGVSQPQAALIKMVLASTIEDEQLEGYMVDLDETNRDAAYLCGRLLAVLDSIQRTALGQRNATIIDRFYGSASTAPIAVFGRLIGGAQPHLAKLRRTRPDAAFALERRMTEIMAGIGVFPRTLTLRQQGMFALGYYHQRAADARAVAERTAARKAAGAPASEVDDLVAEEMDDTTPDA